MRQVEPERNFLIRALSLEQRCAARTICFSKLRMKTSQPSALSPRKTYRHGDLRRALLACGVELARDGGPEAVGLREITRRTGVAPNAAYRHFQNRAELVRAVRAATLSACAATMEAELAAVPIELSAIQAARARLRAIGAGYLRFARNENGWFRTAYSSPAVLFEPPDPARAGPGGFDPLQLLNAALDRLVELDVLQAARREGCEIIAWSGVHGLAIHLSQAAIGRFVKDPAPELERRVLDMVGNGILGPSCA